MTTIKAGGGFRMARGSFKTIITVCALLKSSWNSVKEIIFPNDQKPIDGDLQKSRHFTSV